MCRMYFSKVLLVLAASSAVSQLTLSSSALPHVEGLPEVNEVASSVAAALTGGRGALVLGTPLHSDLCICTEEYNPVCGTDGKDYGNPCMLRCAGAKFDHFGLCEHKECICTLIILPVCGEDGKVYPNECVAKCKNVTVAHAGVCEEGTVPCEEGVDAAACLRDPCDGGDKCTSHPTASCFSNYCPGITRFHGAYVMGPCTAVFVDPDSGKPVDCCEDTSNDK